MICLFLIKLRGVMMLLGKLSIYRKYAGFMALNRSKIKTLHEFKQARDSLKGELQTSKYGVFDQIEKE
jgi:hypothetical protein